MADDTTPAPGPDDPAPGLDDAASGPDDAAAPGDAKATPDSPARPQPSAAAAAASRARRIGGRVTPAPGEPPRVEAEPAPEPDGDAAPRRGRPSFRKAAPVTDVGADPRADPRADEVRVAGPPPEVPVWLRWAPAGVLTAGVITMAVLLTVFSHGVWWGRPSGNAIREQMLAAAKTCVARTNTYTYTQLPKYTTAAHECTTGQLTVQLDKTIKTIVKQYAPTLKATQTAQISRGAIESVSPHGKQWTVLIFGQLTVVNTNDPKGRTDPFAAEVTMEKVHGTWLMSGLKTVATPVS